MSRGLLDSTLAAMFVNPEFRNSYLFYAHIVGQCSIKIDEELPAPAGISFHVDHYNLYINPNEFDKYNLYERLAILKHEILHVLYGHVTDRGHNLNEKLWNISTDCALNQFIDINHLPKDGILPERIQDVLKIKVPKNESSEFYYELLNTSNERENLNSGTLDSHDTWDNYVGDQDLQDAITKNMIETAQDRTLKEYGEIPAKCAEWINLFTKKSEFNWKKILRGILGNKKVSSRLTIMKKDRRFPNRDDLKGKIRNRTFDLLVIADVSGSMSSDSINSTLSEIKNITDITKTKCSLIQVDSCAYEPEKLSKVSKAITRKGHGGTELFPGIIKANESKIPFQAVIVLTDGMVPQSDLNNFSNMNKKIVWLVEPNGRIDDIMSHIEKSKNSMMEVFKLSAQRK